MSLTDCLGILVLVPRVFWFVSWLMSKMGNVGGVNVCSIVGFGQIRVAMVPRLTMRFHCGEGAYILARMFMLSALIVIVESTICFPMNFF